MYKSSCSAFHNHNPIYSSQQLYRVSLAICLLKTSEVYKKKSLPITYQNVTELVSDTTGVRGLYSCVHSILLHQALNSHPIYSKHCLGNG